MPSLENIVSKLVSLGTKFAIACPPFLLGSVINLVDEIKLLSTKVDEIADGLREEEGQDALQVEFQEQLDNLTDAVNTLSMSSRVVELTLCGTGVYTEQAEGSGKPTARLVLQEATTFDLFRALALNSAETSEEDHEKIKRNLKTMEAYLAERKEANARMEDMLKEKKREFFEHEERCALEKAEEAQRDCQDGGKGSVGKAEAEVKQAETESTGLASAVGLHPQQQRARLRATGMGPATTNSV